MPLKFTSLELALPLDANSLLIVVCLFIVLAPLFAALLLPLARSRTRWMGYITLFFSFVSLAASFYVAAQTDPPPPFAVLNIGFHLDALSIYFILLINLVAFFACWYAIAYLEHDARRNPSHKPLEFHVLFNLFHFTMLVVPMVADLIVLWIAVELTTICSTLLVRYRRQRRAQEAAWKFIMITTAGIIFALLGTIFLANAITPEAMDTLTAQKPQGEQGIQEGQKRQEDPMRWDALTQPEVAKALDERFVILSFLFILIGYGTKAGLAPMHTWLPDGHGEAPSPVSALLSGVMLKTALYAILRFYTITNLNQENTDFTSTLLLGAGLFSLALAVPLIVKGNRFKRVLAYHSLEHMGIITFGLGIGGPLALYGALLHTLNHALTKALMFLIFGRIQNEYTERLVEPGQVNILESRIQGVWQSMPLSGIILASGGMALVGSPPFSIFMSEFIILWAALQKIQNQPSSRPLMIPAVIIFLVSISIIFGGLVRHISRLLLSKAPIAPLESRLKLKYMLRMAPFILLLIAIVGMGVFLPTWPINLPVLLRESIAVIDPSISIPASIPAAGLP